ncbi:hypothetical protein SHKM778_44150 [Streptomyces sp. KM77-8]|uniref:Acyl-CoA synthetase n=1 Tax=Streptomyces haneummycinicus TaxID=3074435 RepID=A0AAT9HKS6_9ACTN
MPIDVVRFWAGFGIVIMDAWGLTETTGVATSNSPKAGFRLGSVGRPVESVDIRVAEDGEILVRGSSVFSGYLRPDGSVRSALDDDGWLATGDIGRIDRDGYLWLTDRKKEMIITSTGKNVSPALVENALKEHPLIGQALVHGDNHSYLVALLVLDPEAAPPGRPPTAYRHKGVRPHWRNTPRSGRRSTARWPPPTPGSTAPSRSSGTNCSPRSGARRRVN